MVHVSRALGSDRGRVVRNFDKKIPSMIGNGEKIMLQKSDNYCVSGRKIIEIESVGMSMLVGRGWRGHLQTVKGSVKSLLDQYTSLA